MAAAVTGGFEGESRKVAEQNERFAALIAADTAAMSASFAERLETMHNPVISDPQARAQVTANAVAAIADTRRSVLAGRVEIDDRYKQQASAIGQARAETRLNPSASLRAAEVFFDVAVSYLARHVQDDPELLPCFVIAIVALNESISLRVRQATLSYTRYLLDRVQKAHLDERHRIARDLHDQLGEGLSVALRQLELYEIAIKNDQLYSASRTEIAKDALTEAMHRLRLVTSDLRQDSVASLEKALLTYIGSVAGDVHVRLRVSGDEMWAPRTIIDETFLIIREAIRNALTHACPQMLLVGVTLTPDELHAWTIDDGCGFVATSSGRPGSTGNGLASMRERASLVGGQLTVTSRPGQGTEVELLVPLSGFQNVHSS